ncbi:hypothetical protein [Streptomyces sp. NPDC006551]|uniref:hypothetical protein n=1 Tax=Streptomyces sp. NPDC006551 TaxID=3157178 RepID=UPI0033A3FC6C
MSSTAKPAAASSRRPGAKKAVAKKTTATATVDPRFEKPARRHRLRLGLGLDDVCRVLSGRTTVAGVADAHVAALDAQIRSLKVSRAVLSTVAKRDSTVEETALMNRLARLSAAERKQIIDEFKEEVFGGLDDPRLRDRMRAFSIELPDDPTPEQVDAWIDLAESVRDPGFRARLRTWMELNTPVPGQSRPPGRPSGGPGNRADRRGGQKRRGRS